MILVRKNVYKDVWSFENVFKFVIYFESVGVCFKIARMFSFEIEKVIRSILPTQKSFLFIFFSFDIIILPLIWWTTLC